MDTQFQSDDDSISFMATDDDDFLKEDQNYIHISSSKRRSFVWKYFNELPNNKNAYECTICKASVGAQIGNLGRHLHAVHNIPGSMKNNESKRGRPSRSFIWKYCTRENDKQAFCHLCKKLLYFGGGNTSNITKHLRRLHADIIENNGDYIMDHQSTELLKATISVSSSNDSKDTRNEAAEDPQEIEKKKERKGSSYVWKYCIKTSKHSVRCKLCQKAMSFHGTANVITHLQRKHNIIDKSDSDATTMDLKDIVQTYGNDTITDDSYEEKNYDSGHINRGIAKSVVWKFCKRINKDIVRCIFCEKNLSYQGTSNLQRHLQRMHGVVTNSRVPVINTTNINLESIWDYCEVINADQIKCVMCSLVFNFDALESIQNHMVVTHGITGSSNIPESATENCAVEQVAYVEDFNDNDMAAGVVQNIEFIGEQSQGASAENDERPLIMLYDDLIEEDSDMNGENANIASTVNIADNKANLNELDVVYVPNPLSSDSSENMDSPYDNFATRDSERMKELKEERIRQQAEYFREKAAYYRMQKHLISLRAKKMRAELEQKNIQTQADTVNEVDNSNIY